MAARRVAAKTVSELHGIPSKIEAVGFLKPEQHIASVTCRSNDHVCFKESGFCFLKVTVRQSGTVSPEKKYTVCARGKSVVHRGNQARAQVAIWLRKEIRPVQRELLQP